GPTLLFLDPLPEVNPGISPEVPKMPPGGMFGGGPPPEPKGNLRPLLDIVWNPYNPHPQLAMLDPEIVFIGSGSGQEGSFNSEQVASSGLQEIVMLFPGLLRPRTSGSGPEFIPLLRTNNEGGVLAFSDAVQQG